jgi:hypothetical protein
VTQLDPDRGAGELSPRGTCDALNLLTDLSAACPAALAPLLGRPRGPVEIISRLVRAAHLRAVRDWPGDDLAGEDTDADGADYDAEESISIGHGTTNGTSTTITSSSSTSGISGSGNHARRSVAGHARRNKRVCAVVDAAVGCLHLPFATADAHATAQGGGARGDTFDEATLAALQQEMYQENIVSALAHAVPLCLASAATTARIVALVARLVLADALFAQQFLAADGLVVARFSSLLSDPGASDGVLWAFFFFFFFFFLFVVRLSIFTLINPTHTKLSQPHTHTQTHTRTHTPCSLV